MKIRSLIIFIVFGFILSSSTLYVLAKKSESETKPSKNFSFTTQTEGDKKLVLITPKEINIYKEYPDEITISLLALNLSEGAGVDLKKLIITDDKKNENVVDVNQSLESVSDISSDPKEIVNLLEEDIKNGTQNNSKTLLEKGFYKEATVNVKKLKLKNGEGTDFSFKAIFE